MILVAAACSGASAEPLTAAECRALDQEWTRHKAAFDAAQSVIDVAFPGMDEHDDAMDAQRRAVEGMESTLAAQDRGGCFD